MRLQTSLALGLLLLLPAAVHAAPDGAWRALPARVPGDSLLPALRALEARPERGVTPGEAAYALGQLHFARGEYLQAGEAFARAAARLAAPERPAARYAWAICQLAVGAGDPARTAFDEVARTSQELRPLALLGVAQAWEASGHPERALDPLRQLLAGRAGEAGPAALERLSALVARYGRPDEAEAARLRLLREYPRSIEAARAPAGPAARPPGR